MKKSKLLPLALLLFGVGAASLVGCDTYEQYSIDAPENLQDEIDSIYAANNQVAGDTISVPVTVPNVGADDNSAAWWTEFSQYFTIPTDRLLRIEFTNYGSGANNWNNWNLCIATAERDADSYAEYFVLRSDAYGWGGAASTYDGALIKTNYAELEGDDYWATFREKMQGASVTMDIDHSRTGNVYVTATQVATDGTVMIETYEQPVSATADIVAFLIADGSHFKINNAYTITSQVQSVEDQDAVSISVSGTPTMLEVGEEDYWGDGVATVTFADGSSAVVDPADLTFTVPDLTTAGTKTVIVSYSKTKLGNYGTPVATYYNIVVNQAVGGISVDTLPYVTTYYFYDGVISPVITDGIVVVGNFDGDLQEIPVSNLTFSALKAEAGTQQVTVTYDGGSSSATATYDVEVKEGTGIVGAMDFSNGWWTTFSEDVVVPAGESHEFKMTCYSRAWNAWESPCVILRDSTLAEYAVVRMDNFGWGGAVGSYDTAVLESDWNWDTFLTSLNGCEVVITVTNNGDNTADVYYDVTYINSEKHFQSYKGITVDSSNLQTALVNEESCMILHD